jgi:hypothetical protein
MLLRASVGRDRSSPGGWDEDSGIGEEPATRIRVAEKVRFYGEVLGWLFR